ncbi:hypothetical protein HMPREF0497_2908 [Lentilactobacillus buchneri ATCC 11577]|nr:hypothetical protein HMPREF0497_2908 [Lentilactobacillus buchneri ATCC 11577]
MVAKHRELENNKLESIYYFLRNNLIKTNKTINSQKASPKLMSDAFWLLCVNTK